MREIVLMYHDVYEKTVAESGFNRQSMLQYKISYKTFETHVRSIRDYVNKHTNVKVKFTFDDGGISFYSIIAPTLEKYSFRGTFFVCTKYLNSNGFLSSSQLCELEDRGHKIATHSYSHPDALTKLRDEDINNEWKNSLNDLYGILGHQTIEASIPNGYMNLCVLKSLKDNGVTQIYTSEPTPIVRRRKELTIYGRYVVLNGMSDQDVLSIIDSKRKRLFLSLRWKILCLIKFVMGEKYDKFKQLIVKQR